MPAPIARDQPDTGVNWTLTRCESEIRGCMQRCVLTPGTRTLLYGLLWTLGVIRGQVERERDAAS
jgi:hypothetical protein